ncbi:hypothetical protein ILUMI_04640, partial [Ignelater luminosus]
MIKNRDRIRNVLRKLGQKPFLPDLYRGGEEEEKIVRECIWVTHMQERGSHDLETDTTTSIIPWEYLHRPLKLGVNYHTAILDIASELEETFSLG